MTSYSYKTCPDEEWTIDNVNFHNDIDEALLFYIVTCLHMFVQFFTLYPIYFSSFVLRYPLSRLLKLINQYHQFKSVRAA